MDNPTTIQIIQIAVTLLVGGVLWMQIRSQSQILKHYDNLIKAYDIDKLKTLNEEEKSKIIINNKLDTELLRQQHAEMFVYLNRIWKEHLFKDKPEEFEIFINIGFPHCRYIFIEDKNA